MADTPLDRAHTAMEAAPTDKARRLAFFDCLAGAELFLLLASEAEGDVVSPEIFPIEDVSYVLAFDTEERLVDFAGRISPYAALSGRALARLLSEQGLGLALNPEVTPSATVLPPDAMAWLAAMLAERPVEVEARPVSVAPPAGLPDRFLAALDAKLAGAEGLALHAWLVSVVYSDGRPGHLLAFAECIPGAEPALARAVGEAIAFSGVESGELDVAFFRSSDAVMERIVKVGLRIDIPLPVPAPEQVAPGMDPDRPPRLR